MMSPGLLLINLGTPASTRLIDVGRYLHRFLMDKRVIDLPAPIRFMLVSCLILPARTKKSAQAYQSIWTENGSPLLCLSYNLLTSLQNQLGFPYSVALGMRYSEPSISTALEQLASCTSITVLPLYPQYSSAATGSSMEEVMRILSMRKIIPSINMISSFYEHPSYLKAQSSLIEPLLGQQDHLLFSYHGIPEQQLQKSACKSSNPCAEHCNCYKAQCHQTSVLLAQQLNLNPNQYSTAFQSRLGATPWTKPYTKDVLFSLAAQGIRNLVVACPSFVTDCLETLEEIGIRAKKQWTTLGGNKLTLVPCLNDDPYWVKALLDITGLNKPQGTFSSHIAKPT